jgi:hypothetical protein
MGYKDTDEPQGFHPREPKMIHILGTLASVIANALVRISGVVLVAVGVWAAISVVFEAWNLYRDPTRVERFAAVLEEATGLHAPGASGKKNQRMPDAGKNSNPAGVARSSGEAKDRDPLALRLVYLFAWLLIVLLLLMIGKLANWTIVAGARLVFADPRRFETG